MRNIDTENNNNKLDTWVINQRREQQIQHVKPSKKSDGVTTRAEAQILKETHGSGNRDIMEQHRWKRI